MHKIQTDNVRVVGSEFVIGPLARGLFAHVELQAVIAAMSDAGFQLVPEEIVNELVRSAQEEAGRDEDSPSR